MSVISKSIKKAYELTQLHRHFQQYFQVVPAVTEKLVKEAQRIRHAVYCVELGWEPIDEKHGLETDCYDARAVHCLLRSASRESFIGCIRLVLPKEEDAELILPLQKSCGDKLNAGHPDPIQMANREVAEVSRLAITSDFRRRRHERGKPISIEDQQGTSDDRRKFPYIPVALYLGMLELAAQRNIKTLYILTEPVLARHFSRLGGTLEPIGDGIEHRGLRKPYRMDVEKVLRDAKLILRPLIKTIRKDIRYYNDLKVNGQPIPFLVRKDREDSDSELILEDFRD